MKKTTKKNPQDTTLRNTRSANLRIRVLSSRIDDLETRLGRYDHQIENLHSLIDDINERIRVRIVV